MREIAASAPRETSERKVLPRRDKPGVTACRSKCSVEGRDYLSLSFRSPRALIYANLFDDEGKEIIIRA